ncbi:PAZ domain-containing protein [Artemisia annua]|uniref:PAZ domain-containing protein n=1 Tax=Artemisia annua TaxID=35608 RepID=A0A2U1NHS6_ARTAN|nr:PAZ domain-containing protein [Artemisia annua]
MISGSNLRLFQSIGLTSSVTGFMVLLALMVPLLMRDGVSESRFNQVLNIELEQIMETCKFLDPVWDPNFMVIVAQKIHHTKFFQPNSDYNVPPGTIIDNKVCHRGTMTSTCVHKMEQLEQHDLPIIMCFSIRLVSLLMGCKSLFIHYPTCTKGAQVRYLKLLCFAMLTWQQGRWRNLSSLMTCRMLHLVIVVVLILLVSPKCPSCIRIHAAQCFSAEQLLLGSCVQNRNSDVVVLSFDTSQVEYAVATIDKGLRWDCNVEATEDGNDKEKILFCKKKLWYSQQNSWQQHNEIDLSFFSKKPEDSQLLINELL